MYVYVYVYMGGCSFCLFPHYPDIRYYFSLLLLFTAVTESALSSLSLLIFSELENKLNKPVKIALNMT